MPRVRKLWPFDEGKAERLFEAIEGGDALGVALARAGLSEKCVYAWLQRGQRVSDGPGLAALEPYRAFSTRFRRAVVARLSRLDRG